MINYGKHFIDNKDIISVKKVLKSDWLTQGPIVKKFESSLKFFFKAKYFCAVSIGTQALHLAGLALGWKKGDIVLTTPITFLASSNSILYSSATPSFVDIDNSTYNINLNLLEKKIEKLNSFSKKVVAIVVTDYAGNPCDWQKLKKIVLKYNIKIN